MACSFAEWRKLLNSCQNLEFLRLDHNILLDSGSERPDNAPEYIVLPTLQELEMDADEDGLGHMVFNHVSAPMLHSFSVCHCCGTGPDDLCMFIRPFLQRHQTIVFLGANYFSWAKDVFGWLSTLPDVTIDNTLAPGYKQPLPNLKLYSSYDTMPSSVIAGIISAREYFIILKGLGTSPEIFGSLVTTNIKYSEEMEDWIDERVENFIWEYVVECSDSEDGE